MLNQAYPRLTSLKVMSGKNYLLVLLVFVSGRLYLCVLITLKQWPGYHQRQGIPALKKGQFLGFTSLINFMYILVLIKCILFFYLDFPKMERMLSLSALAGNVARLSGNSNARAAGEQWPRSRFLLIFKITFHFAFLLNPVMCLQNTWNIRQEWHGIILWYFWIFLKPGGGRHSLPNKREHNGE